MSKVMLINTVAGQECRLAIVENGQLEELYIERASSASKVGNIYKGRVTNVEPAIQAAFIDFGGIKNGFLHISDINPQYFPKGKRHNESVGKKRPHRDRPPIQECLRRGQEVVVQLTKEGIGTKGPTMTTYLSIPGRLLVMMPGMSRLGVSRKIEDEQARTKAKQILADLNPPQEMGFIIRTAGLDRPKKELQRDLQYLTRLWKAVSLRIKSAKAPAEIYQESDLVIRTIRDIYNSEIERIVCDNEAVAYSVKEFLDVALPRTKYKVEMYVGSAGLFHDFQIEAELERIYSRRVELRSGGSLVIDQTEALVAIDVNSGRFRDHTDAETTALKINQEAAVEIARQLRLRDMGGVIIIDFIDMREDRNRRAVERTLRDAMKTDRAKAKVLKISPFGLVEMTRQRVRPSLKDSIYHRCTHCGGSGLIKSEESQALLLMRNLQRATAHPDVANVEVVVTPAVAHHLFNNQRKQITELEDKAHKRIVIRADATLAGDEVRLTCTNLRGSVIAWETRPVVPAGAGQPVTIELPGAPEVAEGAELEEPAPDEQTPAGEQAPPAEQPGQQPVEPASLYEDEDEDDWFADEGPGGSEPASGEAEPSGQAPTAQAPAEGVSQAQAPQAPSASQDELQAPAAQPPVQAAPAAPVASAQEAAPGQTGQQMQEGQGEKKRRRRGRRGGRKHKKHNGQGQDQPLQGQQQGQPQGQPQSQPQQQGQRQGQQPGQRPGQQQGQPQGQRQGQQQGQRQGQQGQQGQRQGQQGQQQRQGQGQPPRQDRRQQQGPGQQHQRGGGQQPQRQGQAQQGHSRHGRPQDQQPRPAPAASGQAAAQPAQSPQQPPAPVAPPVVVTVTIQPPPVPQPPAQSVAAPVEAPVAAQFVAPPPPTTAPVVTKSPAAVEAPAAPAQAAPEPAPIRVVKKTRKAPAKKTVRKRKPRIAGAESEEAKARTEGTIPVVDDDDDDEGPTGTPLFKPGD